MTMQAEIFQYIISTNPFLMCCTVMHWFHCYCRGHILLN